MVNRFFQHLTLKLGSELTLSQCILCGAKGQQQLDLCSPCSNDLPWLTHHCPRCALPLSESAASGSECGQCQQTPPSYFQVVAPWQYQPPIAQLISGFKHDRRFSYGSTLGKSFTKRIASAYKQKDLPDIILPTPLHWRRRIQRGFNQSEHLARQLNRELGIPIKHFLSRPKYTTAQQSLNAQQRQRNLRGAFKVNGNINGQRIALVDDVMTTGATVNEISRLLIKEGAAEVHVWVLARTPA